MFKITAKSKGIYDILDTSDGSVDKCSEKDLDNFIKLGLDITGILNIKGKKLTCRTQDAIIERPFKGRVKQRIDLESLPNSIKLLIDNKPVVFTGFSQIIDKRECRATYYGVSNGYHVFAIIEYPKGGYSRDTYQAFEYFAVFNKQRELKYYFNYNGLFSDARTRITGSGYRSYVDLYSYKHNCYFCAIFEVDSLVESLESILVLENGDIMFITSTFYEGKDDDGEFTQTRYHLYNYDISNKESHKLNSAYSDKYGACDLGLRNYKVTEVYGSNHFDSLGRVNKYDLSNFIDNYTK